MGHRASNIYAQLWEQPSTLQLSYLKTFQHTEWMTLQHKLDYMQSKDTHQQLVQVFS